MYVHIFIIQYLYFNINFLQFMSKFKLFIYFQKIYMLVINTHSVLQISISWDSNQYIKSVSVRNEMSLYIYLLIFYSISRKFLHMRAVYLEQQHLAQMACFYVLLSVSRSEGFFFKKKFWYLKERMTLDKTKVIWRYAMTYMYWRFIM